MKLQISNVTGTKDRIIFDKVDAFLSFYKSSDDDTRRNLFTLAPTYEGNDRFTVLLVGFNVNNPTNRAQLGELLTEFLNNKFIIEKIY